MVKFCQIKAIKCGNKKNKFIKSKETVEAMIFILNPNPTSLSF